MASVAIWGVGAAVGCWATAPIDKPDTKTAIIQQATETSPEHSRREHASHTLYAWILGRNLAVYLWLLCGVVSAGLTTVAVLGFNGVALGQNIAIAMQLGLPFERVVLLLVPHGVLELGAFFLAGAVGLQGPRLLHARWQNDHTSHSLEGTWRPVLLGALALAVAAGIEVGVSLPLAQTIVNPR